MEMALNFCSGRIFRIVSPSINRLCTVALTSYRHRSCSSIPECGGHKCSVDELRGHNVHENSPDLCHQHSAVSEQGKRCRQRIGSINGIRPGVQMHNSAPAILQNKDEHAKPSMYTISKPYKYPNKMRRKGGDSLVSTGMQ
eukprot:scpid89743/ scgid14251/ 